MFFCKSCKIYVSKLSSHNRSNIHKSNRLSNSEIDNVQVIASAFKKRIISYKINPNVFTIIPETFLSQISNTVYNIVKNPLNFLHFA